LVGIFGSGVLVADGRPWKYLSSVKTWADQLRANHHAVAFDQAALRLVREQDTGESGDRHG